MKIIIIGLGSIGRRHAEILNKTGKHELYVFRSGEKKLGNEMHLKEIYSWKEFYGIKPDIAFITNPTSLHIDTALKCTRIKCALFIEKPLGNSEKNLKQLINNVKKYKLTTYIAYNLRFHPVIHKLKEYMEKYSFLHMRVVCTSYLPNWRPNQDYKKSYSQFKNKGGGVLLDLSHETDYTSYLLGDIRSIQGKFGRVSTLTWDAEDYADLMLECKYGNANIHINFLSHINQRTIQIDLRELSIHADLIKGTIVEYRKEKPERKIRFVCRENTTYENEIQYFLNNLGNNKMMNNINEAAKIYTQIIKFKNGAQS